MARRVPGFPRERQSGRRRYPWKEWTDGSVWEIRRSEDYDVPTENMRVNLHMRADVSGMKVKTTKITDGGGEGLVFQFSDPEGEELKMKLAAMGEDDAKATIETLFADAMNIYERARREVEIPRDQGMQMYAAVRFRSKIRDGYAEDRLVLAVAEIIRKRTRGFDHLKAAGRPDLTLEMLVVDKSKPYHPLFSKVTVGIARKRLKDEYGIDV